MTIFSNNLTSSSSDIRIDNGYENLNYTNKGSKREPRHYNNNNFHSVDYITLPKPKSHGQSTYIFWTLVVVLFILALGNLILTFIVLGVLRLGQGMESLELVSEESLIKFYGNTDLDNIYKRDGKLEGFSESPLEITGDVGSFEASIIDGTSENRPNIEIGLKNSVISNVESFEVRSPDSGKSLFSTDFPNFGLPSGVDKLDVQMAQTKRVASPIDESLLVKSDSFIKLKGSEGVHIDGKEIIWSADRDIFLKSVNRSLILNGKDGVFIDVKTIPLASGIREMSPNAQYKICVCMPNGKLFRLPVSPHQTHNHGCHSIDLSREHNPCTKRVNGAGISERTRVDIPE